MRDLKGSETERNISQAFSSEAQSTLRLLRIAKQGKKEGYIFIEKLLTDLSFQDHSHGNRIFKFLGEGFCESTGSYPGSTGGSVSDSLKDLLLYKKALSQDYKRYGSVARNEGFEAVALVFEALSSTEAHHGARIEKALVLLGGDPFKRDREVLWHCIKCGYVVRGYEAPLACPACAHPRAYFEVLGET